MAPIAVWNQSLLHENAIVRSAAALPFLVLLTWCFLSTHGFGFNNIIAPYVDSIILSRRIRFGSISIPILNRFLDIKALDDFWRPKTVAFAPSTLGADPVAWFQTFSFLVDYSLLYCIWLFESARKSNEWTPARFPLLFGLSAQVLGIGVLAPLYYFLHYVNTPLSRLTTPSLRSINHHESRAIFLNLALFSYLPLLLMFLGPSPSIRHRWTWAWQMFPLWISIAQSIRTRIHSAEELTTQEENNNPRNDSTIVRATISAFAAVSAGVWISTLLNSPSPIRTTFLPSQPTDPAFLPLLRTHFQINHLSALGSSLTWLLYLFADLKNAHLVPQSWAFLLCIGTVTTICLGPGSTLAAGWYWREEILRRESESTAGVGFVDGKAWYKKRARQSLDEICFGGVKGRFKFFDVGIPTVAPGGS